MDDRTRRIEVWVALADHFLDTETRHGVPRAALVCVEAGLSRGVARAVWRYEVTPALYWNTFSVAGEWAMWDIDWLAARVEVERERWPRRPRWLRDGFYRLRSAVVHPTWVAIEHCMVVLEGEPPAGRAALADDLAWLARHYFDFCGRPLDGRDPAALARLFEVVFEPIFAPLVCPGGPRGESLAGCRARVADALAR